MYCTVFSMKCPPYEHIILFTYTPCYSHPWIHNEHHYQLLSGCMFLQNTTVIFVLSPTYSHLSLPHLSSTTFMFIPYPYPDDWLPLEVWKDEIFWSERVFVSYSQNFTSFLAWGLLAVLVGGL